MAPPQLPAGVRAFLDDDVALLPAGLAEPERAELLAELVARKDAARLDRLGASPDKALAKAARRALHQLRARGIAAAPAAPRVYRVVGPYAEPPPPSYASIVDGRGERVVWYVEPADSGFAVYEVELSETAGILSLTSAEVTRRAWRDQVAHMKRSERALVGEIDGAHARVLVERAYRAMREEGRSPPEAFARWHVRLQASEAELAAPHPARALADGPAPTDGELAALLERPELSLFVPPREAVAALDAAVGEVVTSKLVVDPSQKLAQLEAAIARVADATIMGPVQARLADRLLELALLVAARGGEPAAARACVVAADRARTGAASAHPLLIAMLRRLVPAELMLELGGPARR